MKIGFVIFDGMTSLDFLGAYDPLTRLKAMGFLKNMNWEVCAPTEQVTDDRGLVFTPTQVGLPLDRFDLVVVPGGFITRKIRYEAHLSIGSKPWSPVLSRLRFVRGPCCWAPRGFSRGERLRPIPRREWNWPNIVNRS